MEATLYERISDERERILTLWQAAALPQDRGLAPKASAKSAFNIPSDQLLKDKTSSLLDWLVSVDEPASARPDLREICKVKAVLAQGPSEALGFILDLKEIIRLTLGKSSPPASAQHEKDLDELDKRIDQLLLLAFDEYSDCRERIMEIRINEVQRLAGRFAQ